MSMPPTDLYPYVGSNVVATFRRLRAEGLLRESVIARREEVLEEWRIACDRIDAEMGEYEVGFIGPSFMNLWVDFIDGYLNARGRDLNGTLFALAGEPVTIPRRPNFLLRWWYRRYG